MATTLSNAKLTVRVIEEITLNGTKRGSTNTREIGSINEVSERIITTLTTGTDLLSLGAAAGAGTFIRSSLKYLRITNLDDSNFVRLALITDGTDVHVKVPAGDSFMLSSGEAGAAEDSDAVTFDNITSIKAWADTASVDLEIFIAST
jgi:hypothetical protein